MASATSKGSTETPSTPAYCAPSSGIFRIIPSIWIPYAELMRLDRPAGYYAFYWHYAIGITFAACISCKRPDPTDIGSLAGYLALWVLVYRGAVCTWNDNIDQEFDRQVARCRHRPIARGAVSTRLGHIFALAQTLLCAVMLAALHEAVWAYAAVMTIMLGVYPFGKRMTDFPQVILGFAFAIPVYMCPAAIGADPLVHGAGASRRSGSGAVALYLASTLWTIIFDTVYAHQDIKDDIKAGVKSLAVRLGDQTKLWLGVLSGIQVVLLVATGYLCDLTWPFFVLGCGGTGFSLFAMLVLVDLEAPKSCAWWFGPGSRLVGGSIVTGLLGHYLLTSELQL